VRPGRLWKRIEQLLPGVAQTHSDPANFVDHVNSLQQFSEFRALARTLAFIDRDVALAIFFVAPANRRNYLSIRRFGRIT
jgi:hypothetical protein